MNSKTFREAALKGAVWSSLVFSMTMPLEASYIAGSSTSGVAQKAVNQVLSESGTPLRSLSSSSDKSIKMMTLLKAWRNAHKSIVSTFDSYVRANPTAIEKLEYLEIGTNALEFFGEEEVRDLFANAEITLFPNSAEKIVQTEDEIISMIKSDYNKIYLKASNPDEVHRTIELLRENYRSYADIEKGLDQKQEASEALVLARAEELMDLWNKEADPEAELKRLRMALLNTTLDFIRYVKAETKADQGATWATLVKTLDGRRVENELLPGFVTSELSKGKFLSHTLAKLLQPKDLLGPLFLDTAVQQQELTKEQEEKIDIQLARIKLMTADSSAVPVQYLVRSIKISDQDQIKKLWGKLAEKTLFTDKFVYHAEFAEGDDIETSHVLLKQLSLSHGDVKELWKKTFKGPKDFMALVRETAAYISKSSSESGAFGQKIRTNSILNARKLGVLPLFVFDVNDGE